jgi:hypothetical protein
MNIFKGLGDSALSRITSLRKSAQQYQELSKGDKGIYGGPGSEFSWDEESLVNAIASDDMEALKMLLETSSYSLSDIEDAMAFASVDDKQDMLHLLNKYRNSKHGTKGDTMKISKGLADHALNRIAGLRSNTESEVFEKVAQESGYQGWKNYETWLVALHMDNEPGDYEYWKERVQEMVDEGYYKDYGGEFLEDNKLKLVGTLSEEMKYMHEEMAGEVNLQGVLGDLLSAALGEVDWREIAENKLEDMEDNFPNDEDEEEDLEGLR